MEYYLYISDAKIGMLLPQIPLQIKTKLATEIGGSGSTARRKIRAKHTERCNITPSQVATQQRLLVDVQLHCLQDCPGIKEDQVFRHCGGHVLEVRSHEALFPVGNPVGPCARRVSHANSVESCQKHGRIYSRVPTREIKVDENNRSLLRNQNVFGLGID